MYINNLPLINKSDRINNHSRSETIFRGGAVKVAGMTASASAAISAVAIALMNIQNALKQVDVVSKINEKDLFTPVENKQKELAKKINNISNEKNDFPDDLKQKMLEAIENHNFDLKKVYDEYYSTLNLCSKLEEVKALYPHIKFPATPQTEFEKIVHNNDSGVLHCSKAPYVYLFYGKSVPLHIKMRHYHDGEELQKAGEIIKTAETVNTTEKISEIIDSIVSIYDKHTPADIMEKQITGLLQTMSFYKPNKNKNILEFYKIILTKFQYENPYRLREFGLFPSAKNQELGDLINSLTSGQNSGFADMIANLKNSEDVKTVIKIIEKWGVSAYLIKNPEDCIDLYNLSENPAPLNDIINVFSLDTSKKIVTAVKNNPDAKTILNNYTSYIKCSKIKGLDLQCMIEELGLTDTETGRKALESLLPGKKPLSSKKAFSRRFEGKDFDKSVIEALKQIYIDLIPISKVTMPIDENDSGFAINMNKYRQDSVWSTPNKELLKLIKEAGEIKLSYDEMYSYLMQMNENDYENLAAVPAKRKYWEDFKECTRQEWFTVRLIKDRQYNEKSLYTKENLVESYLYNLYLESKKTQDKKYSSNPLARIANYPFLTKHSKKILDDAYRNIYKDRHNEANMHFGVNNYYPGDFKERKGFENFCTNFNKEAIANSLLKIEKAYHGKFYRMYHSKEGRTEAFKDSINEALDLIYEKLIFLGKTQAQIPQTTTDEAQRILNELDDLAPEQIDTEKLKRMKYYIQKMNNSELRSRCLSCINSDFIDKDYFEFIYDLIQNSLTKDKEGNEIINELKILVILKLHDKFIENSDGEMSEEEFISNELKAYRVPDNDYDYEAYYSDMKSELDFYTYINILENKNNEEMAEYAVNFKINNPQFSYEQANELMKDYLQIHEEVKSVIKQIINNADKCYTLSALDEIKSAIQMIKSWHIDKAEIIILNEAGVNKKVIITKKAKDELWAKYNGNYKDFDSELKKYYKAANKYAPKEGMPGIKVFDDGSAELKLKGVGGGMRMYSRTITAEDIENYKIDENDKMPIKYIFDRYGDHT